jgi:hypothetical protein
MSPATPHPSVSQTIPCTPKASTTSGETPMTWGHRPAARIVITAILAYQALSVAAIIANPQSNPLTRQLSEYALGRQGWLQGAAFLASALSYAALFAALRPDVHGVPGRGSAKRPLSRLRRALAPAGILVLNGGGSPGHVFGPVAGILRAVVVNGLVRERLRHKLAPAVDGQESSPNPQEPTSPIRAGQWRSGPPPSRPGGGRPAPPWPWLMAPTLTGTSILSITPRLAFLAHPQRAVAGGHAPRPKAGTTSVPPRQRRPPPRR